MASSIPVDVCRDIHAGRAPVVAFQPKSASPRHSAAPRLDPRAIEAVRAGRIADMRDYLDWLENQP